jgi:hypothetical protein
MRVRCLLLVLAVFLLALPAAAQLVTVDLFSAGDGLITRDTDSGLDWLDVPLTTSLSYDQIQAGAGNWIPTGWRYATEAEVCHLWVTHGSAPSCNSNTPGIPLPAATIALMTQLGTTESIIGGGTSTQRVNGVYDDATAPATSVGFARIETSSLISSGIFSRVTSTAADGVASNSALATRGSFLVRTTPPAPEIPALPLAGAAALAALLALAVRRAPRS